MPPAGGKLPQHARRDADRPAGGAAVQRGRRAQGGAVERAAQRARAQGHAQRGRRAAAGRARRAARPRPPLPRLARAPPRHHHAHLLARLRRDRGVCGGARAGGRGRCARRAGGLAGAP